MAEPQIDDLIARLARILTGKGWKMATAESCTGGWIAKCCTDLAGSSAWFERGFVTYSNRAKVEMLGVAQPVLDAGGAVSDAVAGQMAEGACRAAHVDIAVAVTGVAGPDGGSKAKPVGTVWFAWSIGGIGAETECCRFEGDRNAVREQTVVHAIQGLVNRLERS